MDEARFQEAQTAYDAGDYRAAAKGFLAAAGRSADGSGSAYHMAGNSLMRLRRHSDAVTVYGHALRDELYDQMGAVKANRGTALAALGDYAEAVKSFEAVIEEPGYPTPYKAHQGMASALWEMGRADEAAAAYRRAALDETNPDPGKALNNLGLCFMALRRPADAVEAYKAAIGFDSYANKGKALANLGIAFSVNGDHRQAVRAFEKATQLHSHDLTPAAIAAFDASKDALAAQHEKVEGWQTGEMPPVIDPPSDTAGWVTGELMSLTRESSNHVDPLQDAENAPDSTSPLQDLSTTSNAIDLEHSDEMLEATADLFGSDEAVNSFFAISEDEMRDKDRAARRADRIARKDRRSPLAVALIGALVAAIVIGGLAAAYFAGYGYPTQTMSVEGMLDAHASGEPVDGYWIAVPPADLDKEMAKLPPLKGFSVESIDRSAKSSEVSVIVTPEDGADLHYRITLSREGVGWKVTGVENDWSSTGGGS
ncbi:MAG: tetratricopeptide repeat protein [Actinomycetota bacterium]|nr:tetratricopeptide repeat protein [Actinomycetota bacterium]